MGLFFHLLGEKSLRCPECAGEMKFNRDTRHYVCMRCGLALTRSELDRAREKQREMYRKEKEKDIGKEKRKDYLKWWLSRKE